MTTEATIIDQCHRLAKAVAPELGPFYIFGSVPPDVPRPEHSTGWANARQTCPLLKRFLLERGEWRGPAAQIVLDLERSDLEPLALFCHELAHCLPSATVADVETSDRAIQIATGWQELAARVSYETLTEFESHGDCTPWAGDHGDRFLRVLLHVVDRAYRAGFSFPLCEIAAGARYGLSAISAYSRALGDEPERLRNLTFAEIETVPAPEEFRALWTADMARYLGSSI